MGTREKDLEMELKLVKEKLEVVERDNEILTRQLYSGQLKKLQDSADVIINTTELTWSTKLIAWAIAGALVVIALALIWGLFS